MQTTRIKKGLNVPLRGQPEMTIEEGHKVASVAVLGGDYVGLKPRMAVKVGDSVRVGDMLFTDKRDPDVAYVAPACGTVAAINRGRRRALQSVVIDIDDSAPVVAGFAEIAGRTDIAGDDIRGVLQRSGLWTGFRERPFGRVPLADATPASIFVTAIDTKPLAADPEVVVADAPDAFRRGLEIVDRLTEGALFVCTAPGWRQPLPDIGKLAHRAFAGPHPAGLPGTHIHHLDPVSAAKSVWHIGYQDVIAIGRLFTDGVIPIERIVALGGNAFGKPRLLRTRTGANVDDLLLGEVTDPANARLIVGSVFGGRVATGPESYLGRYHQQITAIIEGSPKRLFGWLGLFSAGRSFAGMLRGATQSGRWMTSAMHGRPNAMLAIDAFERVLPFNVPTIPLLRALLVSDTDLAQSLGCLEMEPEDLALCSFVCPGKNDYGRVLRMNLERIEKDG